MGKKKKNRRKNPPRQRTVVSGNEDIVREMARLTSDAIRGGPNYRKELKKKCAHDLGNLGLLTLEDQRSTVREMLMDNGTDLSINDSDPTGDGDQSLIESEDKRNFVRRVFAIGGDVEGHYIQRGFSNFALGCLVGDISSTSLEIKELKKKMRDATEFQPCWKEMNELLERRETSMRLSPLLLLVSVGKNVGDDRESQIAVAKVLLLNGARPDAKDVLGKTVCHYGAGAFSTPMTLDIVDMCIRATKSVHFYGKEVELHGLSNEAMNGIQGMVGGFDPDNDRRVFHFLRDGERKEVVVKPANFRLLQGSGENPPQNETSAVGKEKMLTDVQDRFGSVPLHEVVIQNRVDVAEFLLVKHSASIHTVDADGESPLRMATQSGGLLAKGVSKMIFDATRKEARMNSRKRICASCKKSLVDNKDSKRCSRCMSVYYCGKECQTEHWVKGHKTECKYLRTLINGVKLSKPYEGQANAFTYHMMSMSSHNAGSYRNPDGVTHGEKFVVKVQGGGDTMPIMVYDESRTCQFDVQPGMPGFREILTEMRKEMAWQGRKTFMKARFEGEDCFIYPSTAEVKTKYSW
mmetsp:Transcript_95754/g.194685  ORF Transcript_95754/g.194685 Transcript_95754/m.194685 type:complete len:577 (+) Transcript_95754:64-1794(+)|eukprot:CAMPEP_0201214742 /NCGR_PEP_ID=MMETSP0851-20130426/188569_1 /ASSEMBLY_ACC=CAM_ASM_000631 /TAXON_ID=183588 /ORGANISM="Pseudo-nitzschia fraudulenta, Strain WWA7" /LENGTH=576 /DNA_ID=CAMNT_0047504113 /DNA_START=57 /DNA_END=1787 /DNA_ORIENTATION=+